MKNKYKIVSIVSLVLAIIIAALLVTKLFSSKLNNKTIKINLSNLTYTAKETGNLKSYALEELDTFIEDYQNDNLPSVYVTKFLFDGVSSYKPYDLDDFAEKGNEYEITAQEITVININDIGDYEFGGEITGGMIAVNTNDISGKINILLNNVNIDTDSKKVPAIYVYNKDITATNATVTINALPNTKNYLEGGKLKKVSLLPSDDLTTYQNKYNEKNAANYEKYTNYYGVYTSEEIANILFAKVTADNEDLQDGDPYYYYKASGAISSDIDLYFEGEGYLEVTSKNKEGIETKGNLTFAGGTGDYVVNAQDDCLNTTTDNKEANNARNTLTIDVNSMYAIVSQDADEGDAIDSNGELIINGGLIVAIAKPGQDAGIDSETGTYINGGTVLATGDMYDEVKSSSEQSFIALSFSKHPSENDNITLVDENNKPIFSYTTDRTYTNLIYSSPSLTDATYYLYLNGTIEGENTHGYYTTITSYELGTQLAYSNQMMGGMPGGGGNEPTPPSNNGTPPTPPSGNQQPPSNDGGTPPEKPADNNANNESATNKEFTLNGISNLFSGIN